MEMETLVRKRVAGGVWRPRRMAVSSTGPALCGQARVQPQSIIQGGYGAWRYKMAGRRDPPFPPWLSTFRYYVLEANAGETWGS